MAILCIQQYCTVRAVCTEKHRYCSENVHLFANMPVLQPFSFIHRFLFVYKIRSCAWFDFGKNWIYSCMVVIYINVTHFAHTDTNLNESICVCLHVSMDEMVASLFGNSLSYGCWTWTAISLMDQLAIITLLGKYGMCTCSRFVKKNNKKRQQTVCMLSTYIVLYSIASI